MDEYLRKLKSILALLLIALTECKDVKLRDVARETAGREPFPPPYVETYRRGHRPDQLIFIAALHEGGWGPTHRTVAQVWKSFAPAIVLLEGFPTEKGLNPESIFRGAQDRCSDVESKRCDEGAFAMLLAKSSNVPFEGGEPTEDEIKHGVIAKGYDVKDLLGFYVVRQLPQWKREGISLEEGLEGRVNKFIQDYAKLFNEQTTFDFVKFRIWFKNKTQREFHAQGITTEDPAPTSGPETTQINAIARAVEVIRNRHLFSEITKAVDQYHCVLILYGQGHLPELRSSLREFLGPPVNDEKY